MFLLDSLQRRRRRWTKPGVGAWLVGVGAGCTWCHRIGTSVAPGPSFLLLLCHQGRGLKTGRSQLYIFRWKRELQLLKSFPRKKTVVCNYRLSHWRPLCPPGPGSAGHMWDVVLPHCLSLPQGLTHFTPAIWGHLGWPNGPNTAEALSPPPLVRQNVMELWAGPCPLWCRACHAWTRSRETGHVGALNFCHICASHLVFHTQHWDGLPRCCH